MRTTATLSLCYLLVMGCNAGPRSPSEDVPGWMAMGDAGVAPDAGAAATDPPVSEGPKRVFLTSRTVYADLLSTARGADGVRSGDSVCQVSADVANLGGTWKAWLSNESVDAIDRIRGNGPWARLDGVVVFPDHASLATAPLAPIDIDENGVTYTEGCNNTSRVWTGTRTGGRWDLDDCVDWSTSDDGWSATTGCPGEVARWTDDDGGWNCDNEYRLYCFEQ